MCRREYAGILRPACPGTGCLGLPIRSRTLAADHRSSIGFLMTDDTRNTPTLVPTKCSAVRISNPNHSPSLHWSSYFPGMDWVLGILKCTVSPNSAIFAVGFRPRIFCKAVFPSFLTRHLDIRHPACLTIHSTTWDLMGTLTPIFSSRADLSVLTWPSMSWMALSTLAFEFESPTDDDSIALP